jgi:L-alanine-DL-glutamate epimerase-like enolase superfamily enzyme
MSDVRIDSLKVSAFTIPTETPESDGTLEWNSTTIVVVELAAGGATGLGYTYSDSATAHLINRKLGPLLVGSDPLDIESLWLNLRVQTRNLGWSGIVATSVSAIDTALLDLKSKLLRVPLCKLLGAVRPDVPIYGSGGFTSYSLNQLEEQLHGWSAAGMRWVKMKIGRGAATDPSRVCAARKAIGSDTGLFVDANGAYDLKEALHQGQLFSEFDIGWFEEPVTSDNLEGLHFLREKLPASIEVAAGEYGYDLAHFHDLLRAGAVDVLQADVTRCGGITGFMKVSALAEAYKIPISSHCAPTLHLHPACSVPNFRHAEYFYDHCLIEAKLFDGVPAPMNGTLQPDLSRPGFGIELKRKDAEKFSF